MWLSTHVSSGQDFSFGGPLFSLGRVSQHGRDGRCLFTFFLLPCHVTSSRHFLRSAIVLCMDFTSLHQITSAFLLSRTSNAPAH